MDQGSDRQGERTGWGEGVRELPLIEWVIIAVFVVAFIGMFVALNRILKG